MAIAEGAVIEVDATAAVLWEQWFQDRSTTSRSSLFFYYVDWVRIVASSTFSRYPHALAEWQDYVQFASVGVLKAIDRFDPMVQTNFKAFAEAYIKGEILKGVSCFAKDSKSKADFKLMASLCEKCEDSDYYGLEEIVDVAVGLAFGHFLELGVMDLSPADNDPLSIYEGDRQLGSLLAYVERLSERERQVIVAHYFQHLSFTDIADLLGVSKPRITQLHKTALKRIRHWYEEDNDAPEAHL